MNAINETLICQILLSVVIYLGMGFSCFSNILHHVKKRKKLVKNYTWVEAQQQAFQE